MIKYIYITHCINLKILKLQIEDFPKNKEITVLRNKILELEEANDWDAVTNATSDLYDLVKEREKWAEQNNIN